jgi:Tfp pilus assembly ATPase PilU
MIEKQRRWHTNAMRVTQLEDLIVSLIETDDHPEISAVTRCTVEVGDDNHTRLKVHFANGGSSTIMVFRVSGPRVPATAEYTIPKAVL